VRQVGYLQRLIINPTENFVILIPLKLQISSHTHIMKIITE